MNYYELRVRIPKELSQRYKKICIDLDLSVNKQISQLITNFVEIQEENEKRLKDRC